MKILTLNCQRGYQPGLKDFLHNTLINEAYDFILLQEFAKEVPSFVRGYSSYNLLEYYNTEMDENAQTSIIFKTDYEMVENNYLPFPLNGPDPVVGKKHSTFGSLLARFKNGEEHFILGSVHLHAGINSKARRIQMRKVKEQLLSFIQNEDSVIFGGDCNFGYPGERKRAKSTLSPEFSCLTDGIGNTLNGLYSENVPRLPNRIAALLAKFGVPILLSTDHIFVDFNTNLSYSTKTRVLPDRVSDHSPVELILEK